MISLILLCIPYIGLTQLQNDLTCYYENDDTAFNLVTLRPQVKEIEIQTDAINGDTRGFGFWSKYIANIHVGDEQLFYRPFDDPKCQNEICQFNGFYFLKILDDDQFNFAAIILNMNDNPISLTHDFYLFKQNSNVIQQASAKFVASSYENIWFYTSFLYSSVHHKIRFYTNFNNQLFTFDYFLTTQKITIILGGYNTDLSQNFIYSWNPLLYFKGYFSLIQEYTPFFYNENFFNNLFSKCPYQTQNTLISINELFKHIDPSFINDDLALIIYSYLTKNSRFTFKGWIKQNYTEAFTYYQKQYGESLYQLEQTAFSMTQPSVIQQFL